MNFGDRHHLRQLQGTDCSQFPMTVPEIRSDFSFSCRAIPRRRGKAPSLRRASRKTYGICLWPLFPEMLLFQALVERLRAGVVKIDHVRRARRQQPAAGRLVKLLTCKNLSRQTRREITWHETCCMAIVNGGACLSGWCRSFSQYSVLIIDGISPGRKRWKRSLVL